MRVNAPVSLKTWAYGLATLVSAVVILLSAFVVRNEWLDAQHSLNTTLQDSTAIFSELVQNHFDQAELLLDRAAERCSKRCDPSALQEQLHYDLPYYNSVVRRTNVLDATGRLIYSTDQLQKYVGRLSLANRGYFQKAKAGETGFIYEGPRRSQFNDEWSIFIARRLEDQNHRFRGVVYVALPISQIQSKLTNQNLGANGNLILRTNDFSLVARIPSTHIDASEIGSKTVSTTLVNLVKQFPDHNEYLYDATSPVDGVTRTYAIKRLARSPFMIIAGRSVTDYANSWKQTLTALSLFSISLMLLMFWAAHRFCLLYAKQMAGENRLQTILNGVDACIYLKDIDGRYAFANEAVCRLWGVKADKIMGADDTQFFDEATVTMVRENDRRVLELGETLRSEETVTIPAKQAVCTFFSVKIPLKREDGSIYALCGISTDITAQKQARLSLEETLAYLIEAQHIGQLGTYDLNVITGHWTCSAELDQIMGISRAFTKTIENWIQLIHPDDREAMQRYFADEVMGQGRPFDKEYRIVRPADGMVRWLHGRGQLVRNGEGALVQMRGIIQDVTASVSARMALQASEIKYRALVEQALVGVFTLNHGRFDYLNPKMLALLGYPPDTHPGDILPLAKHIAPNQPQEFEKLMAVHDADNARPVHFPMTLLNREGQPVYVDTYAITSHLNGKLIKLGLAVDIGEQLKAQEQSRKLAYAIEQSPESIFITNLAGQIEYANNTFLQENGYSLEEVLGQNPRILHSGKTPPERYRELWAALTAGQTWQGELINRRKDGSEYIEHAIISPLRLSAGAVTHYVAVKQNISERKALEAELDAHRYHLEALVAKGTAELSVAKEKAESANRAKGEFLANMSHEIRTPLNGVLGLAQIGFRENYGRTRTQQTFNRILESGKLLLTVINDILDYSKIEAGKLEMESIAYNPAHLIEQTLSNLNLLASEKGVHLQSEVGGLPPACLGDPIRITQILLNLLSNAVKFTSQGTVKLTAYWAEGRLNIVIEDSGIGMPPEVLGRLFQAFEQADSSTTRKFGGTGLGLVICRRLTQLMQGSLTAQSTVGEGSTFTLQLPAPATDLPVNQKPLPQQAGSNRLRGWRVLVAEDNAVNQMVLGDLLRSEGAEVTIAENGLAAVAAVQHTQPAFDVVLMDVQMPEMDGLEATERIKAFNPSLPIIGQTAHALPEEHARCEAAGMVATVNKPLDFETLIAALLALRGPQPSIEQTQPTTDTALTESTDRIDWAGLNQRYANRPEFVQRLMQLFSQTQKNTPNLLRSHIEAGELADIERIAHGLKGSAGNIFANPVARLAQQTMVDIRENNPAALTHARQLAEALADLLNYVATQSDGSNL